MSKRLNLLATVAAAVMAVALVAAPAAAFADDAVATCDGTEYSTLQAAIDAASSDPRNPSKVVLNVDVLSEAYAETGAITIKDKCFSLDLNGHTIGNDDLWVFGAVRLDGSSNVSISNGSISCFYDCIDTAETFTGALTLNEVEVTSASYAPLGIEGGTVNVKSGTYSSGAYAAVEIGGDAILDIDGGTFESAEEDDFDWSDWNTVMCSGNCYVTVTGGEFTKCVELTDEAENVSLSITGGAFGTPDDAQYLSSSYALLKRAEGKYEVVAKEAAEQGCWAYVTDDDGNRVYFENRDEAKDYAEEDDATLTNIWKVEFSAEDSSFDPVRVVDGSEVGELPEPAAPSADKFFDGWYVGETKVDSTYKPTSDVALTAKWTGPVAECDGQYFQTLQEAINAASTDAAKPSTVKLLKNTEESVTINGQALTLDLGGHTLSQTSEVAVKIGGASKVVLKNGAVVSGHKYDAIAISETASVEIDELDVTDTGDGSAIQCSNDSSLTINSGNFTCASNYTLMFTNGGGVVINGGTFKVDSATDGTLWCNILMAYKATNVAINGGDFSSHCVEVLDSTLVINGGAFGLPTNIGCVASGKTMLKRASGKYEVVDEEAATTGCWAYVTNEYGNKLYYESRDEAKAYADLYSSARKVTNIWKVTLESLGATVDTRRVTEGAAVGELPAGKEVAGYTFSGWYDGSTKVDETYEPAGDVTLVAKWTKDVAPDEGGDSDEPTDDPSGDDKGDKGDDGSDKGGRSDGSDKAMPQTGDAASVAALVAASGATLAALGLRRRK
jgi:uncharacterized repeat protein (TIGR02543 family)